MEFPEWPALSSPRMSIWRANLLSRVMQILLKIFKGRRGRGESLIYILDMGLLAVSVEARDADATVSVPAVVGIGVLRSNAQRLVKSSNHAGLVPAAKYWFAKFRVLLIIVYFFFRLRRVSNLQVCFSTCRDDAVQSRHASTDTSL